MLLGVLPNTAVYRGRQNNVLQAYFVTLTDSYLLPSASDQYSRSRIYPESVFPIFGNLMILSISRFLPMMAADSSQINTLDSKLTEEKHSLLHRHQLFNLHNT